MDNNKLEQNQYYDNKTKMPKMKWRNILIFLCILFLLILLPSIFIICAALIKGITSFTAGLVHDFQGLAHIRNTTYSDDTEAFRLAKLCAIFIFIAGVLKLILYRK